MERYIGNNYALTNKLAILASAKYMYFPHQISTFFRYFLVRCESVFVF